MTFAPGSYTVWHSHPFGQLIIVTTGNGWLQSEGQPALSVATGDAVWIEPGEEHWHGSTPGTLLTHLIIQEHDGGTDAHFTHALAEGAYPPVTAGATENEGSAS